MNIFAVLLVCGIIAALIAGAKNRSRFNWFLLGCIGGLISIAVLACLPTLAKGDAPQGDAASMVTCPNCGGSLPATFDSCPVCGQHLREAKVLADAAHAREEWEQGRRECPHCAEHIKRKAKVCHFCGKDVEPQEYPGPEAAQPAPKTAAHS